MRKTVEALWHGFSPELENAYQEHLARHRRDGFAFFFVAVTMGVFLLSQAYQTDNGLAAIFGLVMFLFRNRFSWQAWRIISQYTIPLGLVVYVSITLPMTGYLPKANDNGRSFHHGKVETMMTLGAVFSFVAPATSAAMVPPWWTMVVLNVTYASLMMLIFSESPWFASHPFDTRVWANYITGVAMSSGFCAYIILGSRADYLKMLLALQSQERTSIAEKRAAQAITDAIRADRKCINMQLLELQMFQQAQKALNHGAKRSLSNTYVMGFHCWFQVLSCQ